MDFTVLKKLCWYTLLYNFRLTAFYKALSPHSPFVSPSALRRHIFYLTFSSTLASALLVASFFPGSVAADLGG